MKNLGAAHDIAIVSEHQLRQLVQAPSVSNINNNTTGNCITSNCTVSALGSAQGAVSMSPPLPAHCGITRNLLGEPRLALNPFRPTIGISPSPAKSTLSNGNMNLNSAGPSPEKEPLNHHINAPNLVGVQAVTVPITTTVTTTTTVNSANTSKVLPATALAAVRDILARDSQTRPSAGATSHSPRVVHQNFNPGPTVQPVAAMPLPFSTTTTTNSNLNRGSSPSPGPLNTRPASTKVNPAQTLLQSNPVAFLKSQTPLNVTVKDPSLAALAAAQYAAKNNLIINNNINNNSVYSNAEQAVLSANAARRRSVEEKVILARKRGGFKKSGRKSDGSPIEEANLTYNYSDAGTQTVEEFDDKFLESDEFHDLSHLIEEPEVFGGGVENSGGSELGITVNSNSQSQNLANRINGILQTRPGPSSSTNSNNFGVQSISVGSVSFGAVPTRAPLKISMVSPVRPMPVMRQITPPVSIGLLAAAAQRQSKREASFA